MRTVLLLCLLFLTPLWQPKTDTDLLGRQVEIPDSPQRINLGESRMLYTMALHQQDNPAKQDEGSPRDNAPNEAQSWSRNTEKFPHLNQIP
ncbi:hypothetical protein H4F35_22570, partial [Pectobacterium versatile]|nr:hypothetical protein [Pectobacterium versatile]